MKSPQVDDCPAARGEYFPCRGFVLFVRDTAAEATEAGQCSAPVAEAKWRSCRLPIHGGTGLAVGRTSGMLG